MEANTRRTDDLDIQNFVTPAAGVSYAGASADFRAQQRADQVGFLVRLGDSVQARQNRGVVVADLARAGIVVDGLLWPFKEGIGDG